MTMLAVDPGTQLAALLINGIVAALLALIAWLVRRAYIVIRDSLHKLEDVQDRIGKLEENDRERKAEYQTIRDELFYLKGKAGIPMDASAGAAIAMHGSTT